MEKMYSVTEASQILKVSEGAIRKWILERRIGFHKIGALVRFTEENLTEFANRRRYEGNGQKNV